MADAPISADSQVVPLPSFWREYLPERLRERAPHIESSDAGDVVVFESRRTPVMAINSIAGRAREGRGFMYRRFADQVPGGHDPHARLADQDRDGVVAEVLYGGLRERHVLGVDNLMWSSETTRTARARSPRAAPRSRASSRACRKRRPGRSSARTRADSTGCDPRGHVADRGGRRGSRDCPGSRGSPRPV